MKKLLFLLIAFLISTLLTPAQIDTTGMSDYEKYYYIKTGELDTTKIAVKSAYAENDDVYYVAPNDGKQVTTVFNRQKKTATPVEKQLYTAGYSEGYEEAIEDMSYYFDDYYYASRITRFHLGFSFGYYSPYWRISYGYYNPWYYDPFFYDPWYSPYSYWGYNYGGYPSYPYYPYYGGGYYPYYPYYGGGYYVNTHPADRGYGIMGSRYYTYTSPSPNKIMNNPKYNYDNIAFKSNRNTIANSSISNDRRINQSYGKNSANVQAQRTSPSTVSKGATVNTQTRTYTNIINKSDAQPQTQTRRTDSQTNHTPTYSPPKMSSRPLYNNTQPAQMSKEYSTPNKPTYSAPTQNRSTTNTQTRSYNSPSRTAPPTQSRSTVSTQSRTHSPAPTYSAPSKSTYSAPVRSSGSNYSTPSRSSSGSSYNSGSYNSGSSGRSTSSSSSSSGKSMGGKR